MNEQEQTIEQLLKDALEYTQQIKKMITRSAENIPTNDTSTRHGEFLRELVRLHDKQNARADCLEKALVILKTQLEEQQK